MKKSFWCTSKSYYATYESRCFISFHFLVMYGPFKNKENFYHAKNSINVAIIVSECLPSLYWCQYKGVMMWERKRGEILEIIKVFCNNCFGSDAHELTPHVTVYDKAIRENYFSFVREYALKMVVKDNILLQVSGKVIK